MKVENLSERFRAIEKLQSIRDCHSTTSATSEIADYAIDLALNPTRKGGKYFVADLLRDARRIIGRKRTRENQRFVSFDEALAGGEQHEGEFTLHAIVPASTPSPAQLAATKELYSLVLQPYQNKRAAMAVVRCLQRGEPLRDAVVDAHISHAYAKKIRRQIRKTTLSVLRR